MAQLDPRPLAAPGPPLPRVLLVDDDATLRRMMATVLEVLDITLIGCASVDQARQVLRQAPVHLLITDLMMPHESGEVLLAELAADPALRAGARLLVFSAGLDARVRARLQALGVWRMLDKPSGVQAIEDCVRAALGLQTVELAAAAVEVAGGACTEAERAAVDRYFAGSKALFVDYRQACWQQFSADGQAGDLALQAQDGPALRRLAHNLKSVLRLLGNEAGSRQAQALEDQVLQADWQGAAACWLAVKQACDGQRSMLST